MTPDMFQMSSSSETYTRPKMFGLSFSKINNVDKYSVLRTRRVGMNLASGLRCLYTEARSLGEWFLHPNQLAPNDLSALEVRMPTCGSPGHEHAMAIRAGHSRIQKQNSTGTVGY